MLKTSALLGLALLSSQSFAQDEFKVLEIKASNPANIKVNFRVDNPTSKTRPNLSGVSPLKINKILIKENNTPISTAEGSKAAFVTCSSCSTNIIHMSLDYSDSVRDQYYTLVNSALDFINKMSIAPGTTYVRVSFFAGDNKLYNPKGYQNWYFDLATMKDILQSYTCNDFTLDGAKSGTTLCNSDNSTRLNSAVLDNIAALEAAKIDFDKKFANPSYTSVIISDGKNFDDGVSIDTVTNSVRSFREKQGRVFAVAMNSKESDVNYFNRIQPDKIYKFKNLSKLSGKLVEVFEDLNNALPVYYSLRICSARRGGLVNLNISSKSYNLQTTLSQIDATNFKGGCNIENDNQWNF